MSSLAQAGGMSIAQGKIEVDNLLIGRVYSAKKDILQRPFSVRNKTDVPLDFVIGVVPTSQEELKEGEEPLPDVSWVVFEKKFLRAAPNEWVSTDFFVSIPYDKVHLGKKYKAKIVVKTLGGGFIRMGLMSKLSLGIYAEDVPWTDEEKKLRQVPLVLDLVPNVIRVDNLKIGKKILLRELADDAVVLKNKSDYKSRKCTIRHIPFEQDISGVPYGYEPIPRLSFLKIKTSKVKVPARGQKEIKGFLKIPNKEKFKGKKFYCVIKMRSITKLVDVEKYIRILIQTEK